MCLTFKILSTCFRGLLGQFNANMYELQTRQRQHLKGYHTLESLSISFNLFKHIIQLCLCYLL